MSFIFIFIYTFALGVSASYEAFPVIQVPVYIVGVCALGIFLASYNEVMNKDNNSVTLIDTVLGFIVVVGFAYHFKQTSPLTERPYSPVALLKASYLFSIVYLYTLTLVKNINALSKE